MIYSAVVFAAFVAVTVASDCSYPCPTGILPSPICGEKLNPVGDDQYHTFSSRCVLDCHGAANPERGYFAISEEGTSCAALGHPEKHFRIDQPNEFDFPYEAPVAGPLIVGNPECSVPCPTGILPSPICGEKLHGDVYHTFRSRCALDCHAARNPHRAYIAISEQGTGCSALGHPEKQYPIDAPNEFDFPYEA